MLWILGDMHFNAEKDWRLAVSNKIVEYLETEVAPKVKPNDCCIVLGDVADKMLNPGSVNAIINKLYLGFLSLFEKVYIIPGNHEKQEYQNGKVEFCLEFLRPNKNIVFLDEPFQVVNIEGKTCIIYPHVVNKGVPEKWYAAEFEKRKDEIIKSVNGQADYAFGHIAIQTAHIHKRATQLLRECIPAKRCIFGHIHDRIDPEYPGSLWATKTDEVGPRSILLVDMESGEESEIPLPNFVEYRTITYPEAITETNRNPNSVYVFEVIGSISEDEARDKYNPEFVSKVVSPLYLAKKESNQDLNFDFSKADDFKVSNYEEAYDEMLKETNKKVPEKVDNLIRSILKPKKATRRLITPQAEVAE